MGPSSCRSIETSKGPVLCHVFKRYKNRLHMGCTAVCSAAPLNKLTVASRLSILILAPAMSLPRIPIELFDTAVQLAIDTGDEKTCSPLTLSARRWRQCVNMRRFFRFTIDGGSDNEATLSERIHVLCNILTTPVCSDPDDAVAHHVRSVVFRLAARKWRGDSLLRLAHPFQINWKL